VNPFGHIDLRVRDLESASSFYGELLPAIGLSEPYEGPGWVAWAAAKAIAPWTAHFGIIESKTHSANENRIAFWVANAQEVDRIAEIIVAHGATEITGRPKQMPYSPGYYGLYFADPSGNRLEVYYRPLLESDAGER
jgi:predicted enzyme related to lactoylglutathione lyase